MLIKVKQCQVQNNIINVKVNNYAYLVRLNNDNLRFTSLIKQNKWGFS